MTRTQIGTATVANGVAETSYTIPNDTATGSHTLYGVYQQNDGYMEAEGYNTLEVRIHTVTTIQDLVASIGETASFVANVKYNTNQNVNEGTVQFQMDGSNIGSPVNVSNGVATLQYEIPGNTTDGDHEITATFIQTTTYGASQSSTGTCTIREGTSVLVQNVSANRDSNATITATITDNDGDNVTSGTAQLYIDNTAQGQPETVSNGSVSFTYAVANNAVLGGHTIKVAYLGSDSGDDHFDPAEGTGTLTVRTPTTLTAVNVSANAGDQDVPITVRVTDPNNTTITSGTVNITVGSDSAVSANVNASGEATIAYDIDSNAPHGTINFTATYVENNDYQGSTMATAGVITIREGVTIVVDSVSAELGDEITLGSTVKDSSNNNVNTGTVIYEIE